MNSNTDCKYKKVENLYKISEKIMNSFKDVVKVKNSEFYYIQHRGVGIQWMERDSETLVKNADIAMYAAKAMEKTSVFIVLQK